MTDGRSLEVLLQAPGETPMIEAFSALLAECRTGGGLARLYSAAGTTTAIAADIDLSTRSLDWCAAAAAVLVAQRRLNRALYQHLCGCIETDARPITPDGQLAYIWFLFSLKRWPLIDRALDAGAWGHLDPFDRDQLADLGFLSFYRQYVPAILNDAPPAHFDAAYDRAIARLSRLGLSDARRVFYDAVAAHIRGDFARSVPAMQAFRNHNPSLVFKAVGTLFSDPKALPPSPHLAAFTNFDIRRTHDGDQVFLISLNDRYFSTYFSGFVAHLAEASPSIPLHIHAIGFDPSATLRDMDLLERVGLTVDMAPIGDWPFSQQRSYFAGARLLHMADYLKHYRAVYVCDVDGVIRNNLDDVLALSPAPVLLQCRGIQPERTLFRVPWEMLPAGNVAVRSTEDGRRFAGLMQRYLAHALLDMAAAGASTWFADQNALFACWRALHNTIDISLLKKPAFVQSGDWRAFESETSKLAFMQK